MGVDVKTCIVESEKPLCQCYTGLMTDGCDCMRTPQAQEKTIDEAHAEAVARGKQERQAVLKRVRKQRALVAKRLRAK
jgi:hypothetical protein